MPLRIPPEVIEFHLIAVENLKSENAALRAEVREMTYLRDMAHQRIDRDKERIDALRADLSEWQIKAAARQEIIDTLRAEVERLQIKLKQYEPVSQYNGLSIEEWKHRADKAEADLAEAVEVLKEIIEFESGIMPCELQSAEYKRAIAFLARMEQQPKKEAI